MNIWSKILDLIYPDRLYCFNCGEGLLYPEIEGLCSDCLREIPYIENYCQYCGRAIPAGQFFCKNCHHDFYYFDQARSIARYDQLIRKLIIMFKYGAELKLKKPLAQLLDLYFQHYYQDYRIDYIIPIPLSEQRWQERGFNQAEVLARNMKVSSQIPVLTDNLIRISDSKPLYDLNLYERRQVIKGIFKLNKQIIIKDKNILLIDDIFTTGTTVNEASLVLKKAGARTVYILTLASANTGLISPK